MLGRLARYLRILGYSAVYTQEEDEDILKSLGECLLLTRDKGLCERAGSKCVYIASDKLEDQLAQLKLELGIDLTLPERPVRCSLCNAPLVYKGKVGDRELWVCPKCGQPYWYGSHIRNISKLLERINKTLGFTS